MTDPLIPVAESVSASATGETATLGPSPAADLVELGRRLAPHRAALVSHPLYARLSTPQDLRLFAEHHVFAVFDFMSLLKALQRELTGVELPWRPVGSPEVRRFVNELVLAEESDRLPDGRVLSHLELYLGAMRRLGADTGPAERLLERVRRGDGLAEALVHSGAPCHARSFVQTTWRLVRSRSLPAVAAAFALGREDVIPDMFRALVKHLGESAGVEVSDYLLYLERHVELDGDHHGPLSERLLLEVLGDSPAAWFEAEQAARAALKARLALWDGILAQIEGAEPVPC